MPRPIKSSGGDPVKRTCLIRGEEDQGRKALIKRGRDHTRVAVIGPDGRTLDEGKLVLTSDILDIQPVGTPTATPAGPMPGIVGNHGTITIPSGIRRRLRLQPGSPCLIEERGDEIVIRPATLVPRRREPGPALDALLAGVTAENIHAEVPMGGPVGGGA